MHAVKLACAIGCVMPIAEGFSTVPTSLMPRSSHSADDYSSSCDYYWEACLIDITSMSCQTYYQYAARKPPRCDPSRIEQGTGTSLLCQSLPVKTFVADCSYAMWITCLESYTSLVRNGITYYYQSCEYEVSNGDEVYCVAEQRSKSKGYNKVNRCNKFKLKRDASLCDGSYVKLSATEIQFCTSSGGGCAAKAVETDIVYDAVDECHSTCPTMGSVDLQETQETCGTGENKFDRYASQEVCEDSYMDQSGVQYPCVYDDSESCGEGYACRCQQAGEGCENKDKECCGDIGCAKCMDVGLN